MSDSIYRFASQYSTNEYEMKQLIFCLLIGLLSIVPGNAQKFGYVNSTQLLLSLPEIKEADSILKDYQGQLVGMGEVMVKEFETRYNDYLQKVNQGILSQIEMQTQEGSLAQEQQKIQSYQTEVQTLLADKKQELYKPILDRVQDIVSQVGKDLGYSMIFDSGIGGILFAVEGDDLMPILKQKLGI